MKFLANLIALCVLIWLAVLIWFDYDLYQAVTVDCEELWQEHVRDVMCIGNEGCVDMMFADDVTEFHERRATMDKYCTVVPASED